MKKRPRSYFALSLSIVVLFLSGCAPTVSEPPKQAIIQNVNKSEDQEIVTLSLEAKTVSIPIHKIDPLNDYLNQVDQTEREIELERIRTDAFTSKSGDIYGDIRYACGVKLCDHALVQIKNDQIRTIPLYSGSIFMQHIFSPDENYMAILLGRNEAAEIVRNNVVVIRTEPFSFAEFQYSSELAGKLTASEFTIPIVSLNWVNDATLKAGIPDTTDYSFETLAEWNQHGSKTKEVILTVK
ncbi:hypothetical protein [Brevibacillus borstelensis]|uniref:hypothetical protein n=1 Tax=Brevibacillus borstelensis TaxID=45462 RepID=UPI0030BE2761